MEIEAFLVAAISFSLGAVVTFLYMKARHAEHMKDISSKLAACERELETLIAKGITVVTYPYKEEHGEDGYFTDDRRAEIGYKFQLFVAGVPCFEAHKTPVEVLSRKDVNSERINKAIDHVIGLIQTFALQHPAFTALKSPPTTKGGGL